MATFECSAVSQNPKVYGMSFKRIADYAIQLDLDVKKPQNLLAVSLYKSSVETVAVFAKLDMVKYASLELEWNSKKWTLEFIHGFAKRLVSLRDTMVSMNYEWLKMEIPAESAESDSVDQNAIFARILADITPAESSETAES